MKRGSRRQFITGGTAFAGTMAFGQPVSAARAKSAAGFSPEKLKIVTGVLQAAVDRGEVDGLATLVFRHGEIAQVDTVGWQDKGAKVPMRREAIFRIMSMTKPVAAVAAMILIDEGKLKLDVPVAPWLRELGRVKVLKKPTDALDTAVPSPRPIRLVDLLTHRSGLPTDLREGPLAAAMREAEAARRVSGQEWLNKISALPLAYEPGTRFAYGNSFDALGILIERVTGTPLPEFLHTRIFAPLGMNDTAYWLPKEKLSRVAALSTSGPPSAFAPSPADQPPGFASGAYGLFSTLDDYLQFARMLLGKGKLGGVRILSRRAVEFMTTNFLTPEQRTVPFSGIENFWAGEGFGLGVAVKDRLAVESGITGVGPPGTFSWPGALGTWWEADPAEDMVQVFMVQGGNNIPAKRAFQAAVYDAIND